MGEFQPNSDRQVKTSELRQIKTEIHSEEARASRKAGRPGEASHFRVRNYCQVLFAQPGIVGDLRVRNQELEPIFRRFPENGC